MSDLKIFRVIQVQWKLDLADTDLAENLDLKENPSENLGNHFLFLVHKSARNSGNTRFSGQKLGDRFFR